MVSQQNTTKTITICRIKFPEIKLKTRDGHKLRGYFGNLFKEHSTILHNHYEDGKFRYKYPLVQYKVIDNIPYLIGIEEGAELLPKLFLKIQEIDIDGKKYPVNNKNIEMEQESVGYSEELIEYKFKNLWMALNQRNYSVYQQIENPKEKEKMLKGILVGHLLNFFRNIELELAPNERIMAHLNVKEKSTKFKENRMIAFTGSFLVNAHLPNHIGLGKSVSRGFGSIISI